MGVPHRGIEECFSSTPTPKKKKRQHGCEPMGMKMPLQRTGETCSWIFVPLRATKFLAGPHLFKD